MIFRNRFNRIVPIMFTLLALCFNIVAEFTPVSAATIQVNWEEDTTETGDGHCTLREAINNAISTTGDTTSGDCVIGSSGADTITLPPGLYTLTSQLPQILDSEIVINGESPESTIIQASTCNPITTPDDCTPSDYRIFSLGSGGNLSLNNLTVRHGHQLYGGAIISFGGTLNITNSTLSGNLADSKGGVIYIDENSSLTLSSTHVTRNGCDINGGGIFNDGGTLIVNTSSMIDHNAANNYGGGAYNGGSMTITDSVFADNEANYGGGVISIENTSLDISGSIFSGNWARDYGGGIGASNGVSLSVSNTTIMGNSTDGSGGGIFIYRDSTLELTSSTLSGNTSLSTGGGIYSYYVESFLIENSTISENLSDTYGGGICNYNSQPIQINSSTISGNSAVENGGGGIYNGGVLEFTNTIIANSISGGDCKNDGTINTNINNLVEDNSCFTGGINFLSGNPMLGLLADNGGPTQTHALLEGSPAIDAGNSASCPTADQRGINRPQGQECDIGSFEYEQNNLIYLPLILK